MERKLGAVIDTNLFISGLFARDSLSAQLQDQWINQEFELVTSIEIINICYLRPDPSVFLSL